MADASRVLFDLARRVATAHTDHPALRAAMVTGSVAKGVADHHSDIDMTLYYEPDLPGEEWLAAVRAGLGGGERKWLVESRDEGSLMEAYHLNGVEVQIGHITIAAWEGVLDAVLVGLDVESPLQKALEGTLICIALHGEEWIERWKARARAYPDALAEAMVRKHLGFFPVWGLLGQFTTRDAVIWYHQTLVESAQNIIAILAGLNRLYFTTFQFKRMRRLIGEMTIVPDRLADRLDGLFGAPIPEAAFELEALVRETLALVDEHMPGVDTTAVAARLGRRQKPWGEGA